MDVSAHEEQKCVCVCIRTCVCVCVEREREAEGEKQRKERRNIENSSLTMQAFCGARTVSLPHCNATSR